MTTCRGALIDSPAASRDAFEKFRTSIDVELANNLDIIGRYTCKVVFTPICICPEFFVLHSNQTSYCVRDMITASFIQNFLSQNSGTPLHESVIQGDVLTTQYLIAAGAAVSIRDTNGATPTDLAAPDSACNDLFKHHAGIIEEIEADSAGLISVAVAHCATLSSSMESVPVSAPALTMRECQLDPSFLWAPPAARSRIFAWARNASIIQLAAPTQPLSHLPDDCAGDILHYLTTTMPRSQTLPILTHCSSPETQA